MTDLLVINPASADVVYQGLARDHAAIEPPLWCRLIAGYVRDRKWSVDILDAEALGMTRGQVAGYVHEHRPRLVCVVAHGHQPSASTQSMTGAGAVCRDIKRDSAEQPVIIVGGHVAALTERTMAEESVDFACNGEGPVTVERLLAGDNLADIPGLAWRSGGKFIQNAAAPLVDLGELHGDVWDLLPMRKYRAHNWQCLDGSPRQPYASIYTSLSCPFACNFCMIDAPFRASKARQYRTRDPASVVAEVEVLYRRYGVRTFKIADEMFVLSPKHYVPICEGLAALPFAHELNIWAYARVDTVKAGHLPLLRRAGVRWLALGIESGSKHVRDGADKHFDDDDIEDVVRAIQSAGINVIGNFMFGLPDDTKETMRATLDMALGLRCEFANFYSAMAYPGSKLHEQADPSVLPKAWSGYSQHSEDCTPLPTATMSGAEVLAFRDAAFTEYFSNTDYLGMIERKFGQAAVGGVRAMAAKPLRRKLLEVVAA